MANISEKTIRGFAKKKNSKNPRLLWKWVGGSRSHSEFFDVFGKSSQSSPKPVLACWNSIPCVLHCILPVHTLLKVVGYYDLSVLSMSVITDGFPKKFGWGWVGGWVG